jgi:hypothetical protein
MVVSQVHIKENNIKNVLLDGSYAFNIIIEQLRLKLGLPTLKPTPYNLKVVN